MTNNPTDAVRIGPIELLPGISRTNFWTFLLAAFVCIGMLATLNIAQSYILVQHLGIPWSEQGALSGNLTLVTEIMSIVLIAPFGILADRIGRRTVIVIGIIFVGMGYALYPYATTAEDLYLYRILFGIGIPMTAAMTATIQNDYPTDRTRGKLLGATAIFNSLGILVISFIVAQLPNILFKAGWDPITAGKLAFGFGAALCFVSAIAFRFGLKGGTPAKKTERLPYRVLIPERLQSRAEPAHRAGLFFRVHGPGRRGDLRSLRGPLGAEGRLGAEDESRRIHGGGSRDHRGRDRRGHGLGGDIRLHHGPH